MLVQTQKVVEGEATEQISDLKPKWNALRVSCHLSQEQADVF